MKNFRNLGKPGKLRAKHWPLIAFAVLILAGVLALTRCWATPDPLREAGEAQERPNMELARYYHGERQIAEGAGQ